MNKNMITEAKKTRDETNKIPLHWFSISRSSKDVKQNNFKPFQISTYCNQTKKMQQKQTLSVFIYYITKLSKQSAKDSQLCFLCNSILTKTT